MLHQTLVVLAFIAITVVGKHHNRNRNHKNKILSGNDGVSNSSVTYTISGLSSGAFFAVQYSVAFSSEVTGVGVVAGGPYYCAQDELSTALDACMNLPDEIDVDSLVSKTKEFANEDYIDSTDYISNQRVYLYSGTKDTVVKSGVVKKCEEYYEDLGATCKYENDVDSEHSMVTNFYGSDCKHLGEPYINNCNYDLAGVILQYIYNNALKQGMDNQEVPYNNVVQIDQKEFIPDNKTPEDVSLQSIAYAYVASNCSIAPMPSHCKLHVVWHGCEQDLNSPLDELEPDGPKFNDTYVRDTGYNGWAEVNDFVILYPQADSNELKENENGCWDWWGYDGSNYAWQEGDQMATCHNMVNYVLYGTTL